MGRGNHLEVSCIGRNTKIFKSSSSGAQKHLTFIVLSSRIVRSLLNKENLCLSHDGHLKVRDLFSKERISFRSRRVRHRQVSPLSSFPYRFRSSGSYTLFGYCM